jgi:hypothetical protein
MNGLEINEESVYIIVYYNLFSELTTSPESVVRTRRVRVVIPRRKRGKDELTSDSVAQ